MQHDFAALNDRRWRAMTNDKNDKSAVQVDGLSHWSRAEGAVIRHRAPLAFHASAMGR
ncbi:MAG: hypothetical protein Q4G71_07250 [Pseudomonadota bacterium]|nr:hypothetical protein [Pseudomonadota bacterium]